MWVQSLAQELLRAMGTAKKKGGVVRTQTGRGETMCYRLDVYVSPTLSPKFLHWSPKNQCVFGDRVWEKVIKVKWRHKGGALIQQGWGSYKTREKPQGSPSLHHMRTQWEDGHLPAKKAAVCPQQEIQWSATLIFPVSTTTVIRNFYSPELWENTCLWATRCAVLC